MIRELDKDFTRVLTVLVLEVMDEEDLRALLAKLLVMSMHNAA